MKTALVLSTLAASLLGGVEWSTQTLDQALAEAKQSGQPVLAYFSAKGCDYCRQQDEGAFSDEAVVRLSERFIRVRVDCTDRASLRRAKDRYKIIGTPTVIVFDPAGQAVASLDGVTSPRALVEKLTPHAGKAMAVVPSSTPGQDDVAKALAERIEKILAESDKRLRADLPRIVTEGLSRAGVAKTATPPAPTPEKPRTDDAEAAFEKSLRAFIPQLSDAEVTGRLKKFLQTKEGQAFVRDALAQAGIEDVNDAIHLYFEKDKDGKYRVKDEFVEQLETMLDMAMPEEKATPKEAPKAEKPKEAPKSGDAPAKQPAWLGVSAELLTDSERADLGLTAPNGFRLESVKSGSPAEKAGLKAGDVLVAIGGRKVSYENMGDVMGAYKAGDIAEATVVRGKEKLTLKITFTAKPAGP